jgi:hypothetical protein
MVTANASIPLIKIAPIKRKHPSSAAPIAQTTNGDILSPPKPKKSKVTKTALLPISRVRTIMKTNVQSSQPNLQLGQEAVMVIAKATVSLVTS